MKILAAAGACALMTFGFAAQASALTFSPTSQPVSGTGSTSLTYGTTLSCSATFAGATSSTGATASVTTASFSGGLLGACGAVTTVLPWTITPTSTSTVTISDVKVTVPLLGITCGPSTISASVTQNGTTSTTLSWTSQTLSGGCTTSGSVTLTPQIKIS
ncbi:MAG: hypothetical protein P4L73_03680 [Caulobacteraceae bacterium]|nr:hypothetical protein [Caulobacteraceae bacterium]